MHHTSSGEPPGVPRPSGRGDARDTLNSGPPSISRPIPLRTAQISSAIHSVLDVRQLISTGRVHPRPILPRPPEQLQQVGGPSLLHSSNAITVTTNIRSSPFVMLEAEEGPESASSHGNQNGDMRIQAGTPSPLEGRNASRSRNPTDVDWNQYKSIITRLYWDENLSMPAVREYMKREHGFDATPRAYKFRFRKWGLRKNIKEHEALQIVSGHRDPNEFWAGNKRVNFERRIARHLEKEGQEVDRLSKTDLALLARRVSASGSPRYMPAPGMFEKLEASIFDVNEWLAENRHREDWFSGRLDLGEDENFFPYFTRGLSTLARGELTQQPSAWADINRAFDHVRGLIASHHPVTYVRLIGRVASFKYYPNAPICLDVCRLLYKHAYELFHEMHPDCHLLKAIWQSQMSTIRDPPRLHDGVMEHRSHLVTTLCGTHWGGSREGIHLGALCIDRYVPSAARTQDEEALRATLETANGDLNPLSISLAQETRLALAELLVAQDRLDEGQRLVEDALAYRDLDGVNTEGKIFWMAELEWRMGNKDASITMLEEALAVVDAVALESEAGVDHSIMAAAAPTGELDGGVDGMPLSAMHVLGILAHRLNIMGRRDYESSVRKRLSPMLIKVQREWGCAFTLHLVRFDLEAEMDSEVVKAALASM